MGTCCAKALPPPDERLAAAMKKFMLTDKDMRMFWKLFRRVDIDSSDTIDTHEFYEMVKEKQSVFVDSIFHLLETEEDDVLNFTEFVISLCTFIMFAKEDVLRFCFFIFDKDKNGFIEREELQALVSILHDNAVDGVIAVALSDFDADKDGRVNFTEFKAMHNKYPQILFPAFRVQANMMMYTFGTKFWLRKRDILSKERNREARRIAEAKSRELKAKRAAQMAEVERRMGTTKYMLCFCMRQKYLKDLIRAQIVEDKRRAEEKTFEQEAKVDTMDESDYNSSGDDGDRYHVDQEWEQKKRERRKLRKNQYLQGKVAGYDRPGMDLDRDRRERRRDVRGTTSKFERVRPRDRKPNREERAREHRQRKRDGSNRKVSPAKFAR